MIQKVKNLNLIIILVFFASFIKLNFYKELISFFLEHFLKKFNFKIEEEKKIIFPQRIIVFEKLVTIDCNYDFNLSSYNIFTKFSKGEMKTIEFQAMNVGKFSFLFQPCSKKEKEYLTVVSKS